MTQGKDVGDALVEPALAPIRKASGHLRDGVIADGLAGFAKSELLAGLKNGIQNAARQVGFPPNEVEKLLPWDTLLPALDKLDTAQAAAIQAYREQAVSVGGLLTGLSRGTAVDVYRESGAMALRNVAQRFVRDKELYVPLDALAAEISTWEALVAQCGDILEGSPLVARSLARRRLFRVISVVLLLVLVGVGASMWWSEKQIKDARSRVESIITDKDPCRVETIASADMTRATPDQLQRRDARLQSCAAQRATTARETGCETLAKNFAAGKLTADDLGQAKTAAALLGKAIEQKLDAEDLLRTPKDMPCQETPAASQFFGTYSKYAAGSARAWASATQVSDDLRTALKNKDLQNISVWRDELEKRAEPRAAKAILSGKPNDLTEAKAICEFKASFGLDLGKKCSGLLSFLASTKR
ncbi:MAG TPA: hypothetical protein PK156_02015 [Polyangium sp.]|nr:hypothetical protein [Polyangium sp.]